MTFNENAEAVRIEARARPQPGSPVLRPEPAWRSWLAERSRPGASTQTPDRELRRGRWLLFAFDTGLALTVLALAHRLLVGSIYFEVGGITVSVWQFRNPCTILVLLYVGRRMLVNRLMKKVAPELALAPREARAARATSLGFLRTETPIRLLVLVAGLLLSALFTFNSSTQDIERFWSNAGQLLTSEDSEALGAEYRSMQLFVTRCREQIPEDGKVYLETDQRPFHINYYLLPRRVYLPLDVQKQLDRKNTWASETTTVERLTGAARAAYLHELGIEWIVHWHGPRSSKNRIERVAKPE